MRHPTSLPLAAAARGCRSVVCLAAILALYCCELRYKECNFNSTDEQLVIYNTILNQLVEQQFYHFYLGGDEERISTMSAAANTDTAEIKSEVIRLQNQLFKDTTRFCNIYLDTAFRWYFDPWSFYQDNPSRGAKEVVQLLAEFSDNGQDVIDSLNSMQTRLTPGDFNLCTSKVLSINDARHQKDKCEIGKVSFSRIFLHESGTKGLLYCNFRCADLCGFGRLLVIEKVKNRWTIARSMLTWIS